MANVWVGDTYYIKSIYYKDTTPSYENTAKNIASEQYLVNVQRIPESTHTEVTEVVLDSIDDSISLGLSNDDLVSAILPKINTALSLDDASDSTDVYTPISLDTFTLKI